MYLYYVRVNYHQTLRLTTILIKSAQILIFKQYLHECVIKVSFKSICVFTVKIIVGVLL